MNRADIAGLKEIVLFALDEPRYALPLASVVRVVRAVEITPLPAVPEIVLGVINLQGRVIPVIDIRRRFRLPARETGPEDHFIIARTAKRLVALIADSVSGVQGFEARKMVSASQELPFAGHLEGVVKLGQGLFLICDLDSFLSLDEARALDAALDKDAGRAHEE